MIIASVHFLFLIFIVMLSLVMLLAVIVLIYNLIEYNKSVRTAGWSETINKKISDVIVYGEEELSEDIYFKALSVNASFRNLFLQKLVDSEKKFSGAAKNRIQDLFKEYDLRKEAIKKLTQKKAYLIARGIRELTVMEFQEAIPQIETYLSHSSPQVYQEAQYAMVRFKGFEGLSFLDHFPTRISEWQQLRFLLSISSLPEDSEEKIADWLESQNDTVIIFTLKLIKKFQLLSFYPKVIGLLSIASVEVRVKAVQTLMSLENPETVQYLSGIYYDQPDEVRLEILRVIKVSKDQCCIDLLKKELAEEVPSGLKVNAAQALYSLGHGEYLSELAAEEEASEELVQIVKYALQEKIC
ncbi:HEAT repeat domain-containing protein [Chryseobacterium cheonjiense]|uniref:HEAT repeat domain-containing protein n=1 Tax=Chryseobacterium cheonjiense TaxID=2728845 RepID=A0A7Y0A6V7_9FLAO|nr:HEAT repeat domain-containing protein [Chryseobacterium cheonjiense]NML57538.1 HEAT repeat domain-containing protein [Chryseobacterium cheonjiense]